MKHGRALVHGRMAWATIAGLVVLLFFALAPAGAVISPFTPSGLAAGTGIMPAAPGTAPWEWEPQLAMDASGGLWAVGGHCPFIDQYGQCGAPTVGPGRADILAVWRSVDAGRTWSFVADPLAAPSVLSRLTDTIGSSDPDIAVAPLARSGLPPIIATVSLYGASSTLAVSADAGRTWSVVPAAGVPGQDRPWLAAAGTCDLYLEYDPIADLAGAATVPRVERYDACAITARPGVVSASPATSVAIEPVANAVTNGNQLPGRLVAGDRALFASYLSCDQSSICTLGVGVSRDRGATWSDVVPPSPEASITSDPTFPLSASADGLGHVAVTVTDRHHVYLWMSSDGARTWPVAHRAVDAELGWSLANVPSVAVQGSHVEVAWFGSPVVSGQQPWYLVMARSDDGGLTWRNAVVAPVLATTAHDAPLGAALYDDFGTAVTPAGDDVAVYTQSCQGHPTTDPLCPGPPAATGTYDMTRFAWLAQASGGAPRRVDLATPPAPATNQPPPHASLPATGTPPLSLFAGAALLACGLAALGLRRRLSMA